MYIHTHTHTNNNKVYLQNKKYKNSWTEIEKAIAPESEVPFDHRTFGIGRLLTDYSFLTLLSTLLLSVPLWLLDLGVSPSTGALMFTPPWVSCGGDPVHRSLHVAKVGFPLLARTVTAPPVLAVGIHLIMESVVDL